MKLSELLLLVVSVILFAGPLCAGIWALLRRRGWIRIGIGEMD